MNEPEQKLKDYWDSLPEDTDLTESMDTLTAAAQLSGARNAFAEEGFPKAAKAINAGLEELVILYLQNQSLKNRLNLAFSMMEDHGIDNAAIIRHLKESIKL